MGTQIICDECGEPIDQSALYYTGSVNAVQMINGVLTSSSSPTQLDYHVDHLPSPTMRPTPDPEEGMETS
jgi:hypothetical protein